MLNLIKINHAFHRMAETILRLRWVSILLFFLITGLCVTGMKHIRFDTSWDNWFLENDPMKIADDEFKSIFGNNEYVAVLVEVDDVFTPEVLTAIRQLGAELKARVPFSDDVLSITDCEFTEGNDVGLSISDLVPDPVPQSPEELDVIRAKALSRDLFVNRIVSDDSRQTWILLRMKTYPEKWRNAENVGPDIAAGEVASRIITQEKYKILNPRGAGLPHLAFDKTAFFKKETARNMRLSIIATVIVLALAIRTVTGVVLPMLMAFSAFVITFGIQGYLGTKIDPSMILVPVYLGLAVAIGYAIHLFGFFNRHFAETGNRKESVLFAVSECGWPVFFTALTTMGALLSFHFVPVRTIRWVGSTASALVAVTFVLTLFLVPSVLSFGKDRKPKARRAHHHTTGLLEVLSHRVLARPTTTAAVFMTLFLLCAAGISRFEVSFDIIKSFGLKIPYVAKIHHVANSKVGSLYSYDLTVTFPEAGDAKLPANLETFAELIREAEGYELTKRVTSLIPIIKDMNRSLHSGDDAFHTIPENRQMVAQLLLLYENAGGAEAEKWVDYDYQRLRMQIEMGDYNSAKAKRELESLKAHAQTLFPHATIGLAGSIAKFTFMQAIVSSGQLISFAIALGVVTLLMMLVFGSVKIGLIAMIPNIAPALAIGGLMGWGDIPLDMMTITIMPMLLGLAVDDTIHFINHCRLEFQRTGNYDTSIRRTFNTIGVAICMTSVIITANFSVYTTSVAKVYVHLGLLTGIGILTALAADLFVTPALLLWTKPFGKERQPLDAKAEKAPDVRAPGGAPVLTGCARETR
ncbi:efflux RND transporter permease subunit [Desulfoluna butyratoxydans]|uniref:Membrane transport protein mmpl domain n=1 Tax=Desulfoluna butyratoxydans TaxID=231438 RepID=A0A4U8YW95_9BACT|nr:MMPL family transporter [Desulfoluna butyratoxydans]VFQ46282.1 membrane transport protein mmpl domain [Desulfoluna butyratoxydans]